METIIISKLEYNLLKSQNNDLKTQNKSLQKQVTGYKKELKKLSKMLDDALDSEKTSAEASIDLLYEILDKLEELAERKC